MYNFDPLLKRKYNIVRRLSEDNPVWLVKKDENTFVAKIFTNKNNWHTETKHLEFLKNVPEVIELKEYFEDDDSYYEILEYFEGTDLIDFILKYTDNGVLPSKNITKKIMKQIINIVKNLHEKNIVHRDIKPENFLINDNHEIKIIDFEFAVSDIHKSSLNFAGTANYMSPEMAWQRKCTSKIDNWSLGVMLYIFATGHLPYADKYKTHFKPAFTVPVSLDLKECILGLLEYDPEKRFTLENCLQKRFFMN